MKYLIFMSILSLQCFGGDNFTARLNETIDSLELSLNFKEEMVNAQKCIDLTRWERVKEGQICSKIWEAMHLKYHNALDDLNDFYDTFRTKGLLDYDSEEIKNKYRIKILSNSSNSHLTAAQINNGVDAITTRKLIDIVKSKSAFDDLDEKMTKFEEIVRDVDSKSWYLKDPQLSVKDLITNKLLYGKKNNLPELIQSIISELENIRSVHLDYGADSF